MKKFLFSVFLAHFMVLISNSAQAQVCMPCKAVMPMQELVANSEVVIIARRSDSEISDGYHVGPEIIELEVLEILKGNDDIAVGDEIDAQAWYGICPYGVQMERYEKAVLFLNKNSMGVWPFSNPLYEAATFTNALCNDEAMTLKGKDLIIWDPGIRKEVKYPLTEFKRVFTDKFLTPEQKAEQVQLPQQLVVPEQTQIPQQKRQ